MEGQVEGRVEGQVGHKGDENKKKAKRYPKEDFSALEVGVDPHWGDWEDDY